MKVETLPDFKALTVLKRHVMKSIKDKKQTASKVRKRNHETNARTFKKKGHDIPILTGAGYLIKSHKVLMTQTTLQSQVENEKFL